MSPRSRDRVLNGEWDPAGPATAAVSTESTGDPTAAANYCRAHAVWPDVLARARARYSARGQIDGARVSLPDAVTRRAVAELRRQTRVAESVTLAQLDQAWRESKFACGLVEVLEAFFGERIRTRRDESAATQAAWEATRRAMDEIAGSAGAPDDGVAIRTAWLAPDAGYLATEWGRLGDAFLPAAAVAIRAVARAQGAVDAEPLPVFAQRVAGDPKALDRGSAAGRYFERGIAAVLGGLPPGGRVSAADRDDLLAAAGLSGDEVSSSVTVMGLLGDDADVQALRAGGRVWTVPLMTVRLLSGLRAWRDVAFVVENRGVFRQLAGTLTLVPAECRPTLICSSGRPSLATRLLLGKLAAAGTTLRYSGDFDVDGLAIAQDLRRDLGPAVEWWRLDATTYRDVLEARGGGDGRSDVKLSTEDVTGRLAPMAQEFSSLVLAMQEIGTVVFQEAFVEVLAADLLEFGQAGVLESTRNDG